MESRLAASERAAPPTSEAVNRSLWRRSAGPAVVLAAAALAIAPQILRGASCGHDFDVHLISWLDCARAWRHGILYPHWTPSPNWGAGEPRFVFYPPLTWMLGALLGLLFSWQAAPILFTFLCLAGAGLATRALARESCSDAVATLAGCTAIFSGFTLFTAYERAAFPEFTGGVWLPLLLLFALRDRNPSQGTLRRALDGSAAPLALTLAACWLCNAPLGVMASYLLAGVALLAALSYRSWAPLLRAAFGAVLGLALSALYWIPSAWEQRWVDIREATQDPGLDFENNWLFARHRDPNLAFHDQVLHNASVIAISTIVVALICLAIAWWRGTLAPPRNAASRHRWIPLAVIPCVVLFLLLPVSRPVWQFLPKFRFLQFPWRWMESVGAPMAIFLAAALWPAGRRARLAAAAAFATAFVGMTLYANTHFFQVGYPEDSVASVVAAQQSGAGAEGMFEYQPPQSDIGTLAMNLPGACLVSDPATVLGKVDDDTGDLTWTAAQGSCAAVFPFAEGRSGNPEHLRVTAQAPHSGWLVLRLLRFPAWRIQVNGQPAGPLPHREDGLLAVPVPAGPIDLRLDWTTTPDVLAGRWISLLGVLALAALGWLERKLRPSQVS